MRMMWLMVASLSVSFVGLCAQADEVIALKVLYAGNPGSDREQDFNKFLKKSFATVGTTDYRTFKEDSAKDYDVLILDWTSMYPRDHEGNIKKDFSGLNTPTPPSLSSRFDRPTILIGAAGCNAAQALQLKINWL
jgi:hypothetical protein